MSSQASYCTFRGALWGAAACHPLAPRTHLTPAVGGNGLYVRDLMILPSTASGTSSVFSLLHPVYNKRYYKSSICLISANSNGRASRLFQSSSAEAATGKAFTPPLCKISVSDGPDAGIIHQALGNNEEWCRSLFISLLVILLERYAALHLTQMCAACLDHNGTLSGNTCLDTLHGACY